MTTKSREKFEEFIYNTYHFSIKEGANEHNDTENMYIGWKARQSEIDALREKLQWRDIKSAPKDGTTILLYDHSEGFMAVGYWKKHQDGSHTAWRLSWNHDEFCVPTHWLPLPPEVE